MESLRVSNNSRVHNGPRELPDGRFAMDAGEFIDRAEQAAFNLRHSGKPVELVSDIQKMADPVGDPPATNYTTTPEGRQFFSSRGGVIVANEVAYEGTLQVNPPREG